MRAVSIPIAAALLAAPAAAQAPRVPVPLIATEGIGACSTAYVYNLAGTDGFLSVRAAPSRRARVLARLVEGQNVYACVRRGDWFGIVFEQGNSRRCAEVLETRRTTGVYRGPCRSGWVHERYLGGYADWVSP
ncbi:MAG TPA: hypothetical protein VMG08_02785 [Allosphingosinicella sp.]|nr:hypothetical protein [Allosphingosinicella sp.]